MDDIYNQFDISSKYGFLMEPNVKYSIRKPYDKILEICEKLPYLIKSHEIQNVIDDMEIIIIDDETTDVEYKMLYSMLCLIQSGYIWHNGEGKHNKKVPRQIVIPLHKVSEYLGIQYIITHYAIDCYNWKIIDETKPITLDNVKSIFTITSNKSEIGFCMVAVVIEYYGKNILDEIIRLNILDLNESEILESFIVISNMLTIFNETMDKMYEVCDPDFFYGELRIFLAGWTNKVLFPEGMELEGINYNVAIEGASAGQSAIIHVLDTFFCINHKGNFHNSMRKFMPKKHADFIIWVSQNKVAKDFVLNDGIKNIYNECIDKLGKFRSIHLGFIKQYIIDTKQKAKYKSAISEEGSGGTNNIIFTLKEFKNETLNAMII